ncbi:MAG TPA: rhodanese-like domain-containing protein [Usitatibacteraceae bacterium]|nr:rhodanese-like domain-containing protein [Usitatibacteraceae bacterium]
MGEFLLNNLALVGLFLASGALLLWPEISRFAGGASSVGTLDATRLMNQPGALVLDVRETAEFAAGHLPRARHIPLGELGKRLDELARFKDKPVIVTCRSGSRSGSACRTLRNAGFSNVHNLKGGVPAWEQASLPVER